METATCFFASTSWFCMSTTIWFSIFWGSSALLMRSFRFDLMSVPRREKIPMAFSFYRLETKADLGGDPELRQDGVMLADCHRHVVDDRLELVEVQVLKLEGMGDDHGAPLDAEGAVHH